MQIKNIVLSLSLAIALVACSDDANQEAVSTPDNQVEEQVQNNQEQNNQENTQTAEQLAAQQAAQDVIYTNQKLIEKHPSLADNIIMTNKMSVGEYTLFEVVLPQSVIYTDKEASFILVGNMFSGEQGQVVNYSNRPAVLQAQQNAQLERGINAPNEANSLSGVSSQQQATDEEVAGRDIFLSFPFENGFNYTYGEPNHKMVIFEDPDCPYCQKLHSDLQEWASDLNVEVAVFPYILQSTHPNAIDRAKSIMCSANPTQAWKDWMLTAYEINKDGQADLDALWDTWSPQNAPDSTCAQSSIVDMWQQVGQGLGLSATPTIIFENGLTAEGMPDKDSLVKTLQFAKVDAQRQDALKAASAVSSQNNAPQQSTQPTQNPSNQVENAHISPEQHQMVEDLMNEE